MPVSSTASSENYLEQATDAEKFRLLVENALDYGIFMLNPQGNVVSWNVGAERIKGYSAAEIIGRHFSVFYTPEAITSGWPEQELELAKAQGRFEDEGWRLRKDGSKFWANVIITAVKDENGWLIGFAKITRDLTAKRDAQRIEEEGRHIYRFLATLAHELRNPLAPLVNAVALMKTDLRLETTEWARDVIDRQTTQLTRLVDDLLDVQRVVTGKILLRRGPVDLRDAATDAVEATRDLYRQRGHKLSLIFSDQAVTIDGDKVRLVQMMVNLLTNAAKYTPDGGYVSFTVFASGGNAEINIVDNGVGVEAHMLPQIFEAFVQVDSRPERAQGGLGIGLSLVRELVKQHGGTITASSAGLGKGSAFHMTLPLAPQTAKPAAETKRANTASRSARILIVDDNRDAGETLAVLLRQHDHMVESCHDPREAQSVLQTFRPDVVLLDIGMPGVNGYELARLIRADDHLKDLKLIAATGYGRPEDKALAKAAGFDHHLAKPIDLEELRRILN